MMIESEQARPTPTAMLQVRRAWLVLGFASLVFVVLVGGALAGLLWVYRHATEPEVAKLSVVSGSGALVRSPTDLDWRLVSGDTAVREGDQVSTALGTVVTLRMFDGSTVEVTEDTVVRIERMRSSRFLNRTKLIVLEPERGTVYISMASRGEYAISEITTRVGDLRVKMTDEPGRADAGSYLVEVREVSAQQDVADRTVRAAVLHGEASIERGDQSSQLKENEQVLIAEDGSIGDITPAVRELLVNGDFSHGLSGWIEFEQVSQRHVSDSGGSIVELAPDETTQGSGIVVELARTGDGNSAAQVGIRQRIGKTLRVHTSLLLSFETRIMTQHPAGGGENLSEFPLTVELNYIDVDDQEQVWSYGYYVLEDDQRHIPIARATKIDRDRWQRVIVDLRDMSPLPKQITSIVVYASGQSYQTRIANISLTTSELAATGP